MRVAGQEEARKASESSRPVKARPLLSAEAGAVVEARDILYPPIAQSIARQSAGDPECAEDPVLKSDDLEGPGRVGLPVVVGRSAAGWRLARRGLGRGLPVGRGRGLASRCRGGVEGRARRRALPTVLRQRFARRPRPAVF